MNWLATLPWYFSIPLCLFLSAFSVLMAVALAFGLLMVGTILFAWASEKLHL